MRLLQFIRQLAVCLPVQSRRGQAAVEYLVVAGMMLASLAILVVFLATFREAGGRALDLAGSEYP